MNCDNRLLTSKDVSTVETQKQLVKLSSSMSESDKLQARKFAVLLVSFEGELFRTAGIHSLVPETSTMVRDNQGQLVGISAVSGG